MAGIALGIAFIPWVIWALLFTQGEGGAGDVVGPVVHRYLFDPSSRELGLKEQTRQRRQDERRLINDLAAWEVELDKEKRVLSIVMRSTHGATVTRSYRLP